MMIYAGPRRVWCDAKVPAASIESWPSGSREALPFPVQAGGAIHGKTDASRVPAALRVAIQAIQPLMEVVVVCVPATLIQQADVRRAAWT